MLLVFTLAPSFASPPPPGRVLAEFVLCNYTWDAAHSEAAYTADGRFIVANNVITGIKVWRGVTFLTVPRWRPGVPSTLNTLEPQPGGLPPLLRPFPSWESNALGDCNAIQYVQSMEIDEVAGLMWVLDVGRVNLFGGTVDNSCPPKLVVVDLSSARAVSTYVFPDAVAPRNASFLNDIVLDVQRRRAFISDAGTGALVAFDAATSTSRRYADASTRADPSVHFEIDGVKYPPEQFTTPADGIALTPDGSRVFYCALQGLRLWSVDAGKLADVDAPAAAVLATQRGHGAKPSPSDGIVFDCTGRLWFGGLTTSALYAAPAGFTTVANATLVQASNETLHWVDTFAFDGDALLLTSNRLDRYFVETMRFDGSEGANFRVVRFESGARSYMVGPC